MKKLKILFAASCSCAVFLLEAEATKYKIKEYTDQGPIRITFKHQGKYTKTEQKYELTSLNLDSIGRLVPIRCHPKVCETYADHSTPSEETVLKALTTTLLPRIDKNDSLFPLVLKRVTKTQEEHPTKFYEVLGLFNVGVGFKPEDRQYGYYISSGRQLGESEASAQGRLQGRSHFENWGEGLGSTAANIAAHFVMQFHEKAPETITVHPKKDIEQTVKVQRKRFAGVLSGTCDPDNISSSRTMEKAGLRKLSLEEIETRGIDVTKSLKTTIKISESNSKEIIKDYYEMTWDEFQKNVHQGLY